MSDLFDHAAAQARQAQAPLAERLRPKSLDQFVGQADLVGEHRPLRKLIESDQLPSMILWGPPGSGKTTLARIIACRTDSNFVALSAVLSGVKDLRTAVERAKEEFKFHRKKTILFIDEIHRFNKAQQDALLPHVEAGTITLIGATTENPSFEVIGPLLSRCRVFVLNALTRNDLKAVLSAGTASLRLTLSPEAEKFLLDHADGDARRLLNTLEVAATLTPQHKGLNLETVAAAAQQKTLLYDKGGEEHYNVISAFIKSMRGSDPDAAVYYLARMYEAGEDPRFIARRMVIFAAEDISLADPNALTVAVSAFQAYDLVGRAEGWIPLSEAAIYLARAPKSNETYQAYKNAKREVAESGPLPVPLHLRNAPTELMKELNYGRDYRYPHADADAAADQTYLPEALLKKQFYSPKA